MAENGIPDCVKEWLGAHPLLWGSAEWQAPIRLTRVPYKMSAEGAKRYFRYAFVTAAREEDFFHVVNGDLTFACDAANVLAVQVGLRFAAKSTSADIRTFGDNAAVRMVRLLIRNMIGMGKTLDTPVAPPLAPMPFAQDDEDLSVDMDAGLADEKGQAWTIT